MVRIRYTAWDGTQAVRLDPGRVFDALADLLSRTDDLAQALDWLLRRGLDLDGVHVMGLDEALERLREAIRSRENELNLDHALDEPRSRLDDVLARERETLDDGIEGDPDGTLAREKKAFLDDLPGDLAAAIDRLARDYRFEDEGAERAFRELVESLEDVRSVEDFRRAEGGRFRGPRDLDFPGAVELVREIATLRELERGLAAGELPRLDVDALRRLLGDDVARDLERLGQVMILLRGAGYLREREGRVELSARGVRRIGALALRDIYEALLRDRPGGHPSGARGPGDPRPDRTRRWEQGDALDVALVPTLMNAIARGGGTPVGVEPRDFEVRETDQATTASTVLLLDMSWSMSWEGRFAAAKKVALALESLVRTRFPRDYFGIVGFYTRAVELRARDLPEATWNVGDPFTNLQDGLRMAGRLLAKHPSSNQHVIVVTDGQPTAYFHRGRLHCEWPLSFGGVSLRASAETLREVERVTRRGITINTFMLDDSPGLRAFVERMTRINRGRALYSRPDRLGEYLLVDYLGRKRKRI
ncbi:VWA domain-containing protein [bacterium]|nr:VWA domain-containing protein [bacterium]